MTTAHYVIALVRLALLACPVLVAAHLVRTRCSALRGAPAILVESVLALAWLLAVAQLFGLVSGRRLGWLAAALWVVAAVSVLTLRPRPARAAAATTEPAEAEAAYARRPGLVAGHSGGLVGRRAVGAGHGRRAGRRDAQLRRSGVPHAVRGEVCADQYLVLTPAPTAAIPLSWSQSDPALTAILHPNADDWVFRIAPGRRPSGC
jgi:hypothetical protein